MQTYRIADVSFSLDCRDKRTEQFLKDYAISGESSPAFSFRASDADLIAEGMKSDKNAWYFESLAVYRKLLTYLMSQGNAMVLHASAIMVDGKAYLFTAPSGTGKSTHARYLTEYLGDRAVVINDDKPIIKFDGGKFFVYGTPWDGKHRLSANLRAPLGAICILNRGKENIIEKGVATEKAISVLLGQTLRFSDNLELTDNTLKLVEKLIENVELYSLWCTNSVDSAKTSYEKMIKGRENED